MRLAPQYAFCVKRRVLPASEPNHFGRWAGSIPHAVSPSWSSWLQVRSPRIHNLRGSFALQVPEPAQSPSADIAVPC